MSADGYATDTVTRLETNLDDLSPELTGATFERLLTAGALDVWLTPIQMKKNRPGVQLSVLCDDAHTAALTDLIFTETSAFGLRVEKITRLKLERRFESVSTAYGDITIKLGLRHGRILQIAPEFESCRAASARTGAPLRTIFTAAASAAEQRFPRD